MERRALATSPLRGLAVWIVLLGPSTAIALGYYGFRSAWMAIGLYHAWMVGVLLYARAGASVRELARGRTRAADWLFVAACALLGPVMVWAVPLVGGGAALLARHDALGIHGPSLVAFAIYYSTVGPLLEEAYWRGFVARRLDRPVLSDLAFGGYHVLVVASYIPWGWAAFSGLALAVVASIWRAFQRRTGGLLIPAASHVVADASFMVGLDALRRAGAI